MYPLVNYNIAFIPLLKTYESSDFTLRESVPRKVLQLIVSSKSVFYTINHYIGNYRSYDIRQSTDTQ